jgi:hypothetical protein
MNYFNKLAETKKGISRQSIESEAVKERTIKDNTKIVDKKSLSNFHTMIGDFRCVLRI